LVQEGTGINPLFISSLVPILIKYGDEISTSAAVESNFKKLKTVTMKNLPDQLPWNVF
jgi:hypothetical protein